MVANCDDVLMTSAAYDCPNVVWVAAGGGWANDSVSCPRSGEVIVRETARLVLDRHRFQAAQPAVVVRRIERSTDPKGCTLPMRLSLPGTVNRGNAAQAVAAAVALGADPAAAVAAVSRVDEVAGRYRTVPMGDHTARILLAKNPAGWQEALSMVDTRADGVVIAVNGQVPDGEDLSWLWDVNFEHFASVPWWPPVSAAPIWRCDSDMPGCRTRWYTTPSRPSRRARRGTSKWWRTTRRFCS